MYETIITALEEIGICVDADVSRLQKDDYDINLQEYINDSITFITFIIQLEEKLGIELPDDMVLYGQIASIKSFALNLSNRLGINAN